MDRSERRALAIERMQARARRHPHAPLPRPAAVALVAGPFVLIGLIWALGYVMQPRPGYGYPADEAREYRIVEIVPERRSQPVLASVSDVRFHLEDHGVPCDAFEEIRQEPSPEGLDLSGEVHVWGECDGGRTLLYRYSHQPSKVAHLEDRAPCSWGTEDDWLAGIAPYKPNYWLEGPNWTVYLARDPDSDDAVTLTEVRTMARRTGARVYRSCAPSASFPARPVRVVPLGTPFTMDDLIDDHFTVTVLGAEAAATSGGRRILTVRFAVEGSDDMWLDLAVHAAGSETYWSATAITAGTTDEVRFAVPADLVDPVLRISTAQEGETARHNLADVPLERAPGT